MACIRASSSCGSSGDAIGMTPWRLLNDELGDEHGPHTLGREDLFEFLEHGGLDPLHACAAAKLVERAVREIGDDGVANVRHASLHETTVGFADQLEIEGHAHVAVRVGTSQ